ncbi:MAG: hypothetical protein Q9198_009849, partial [Flavoplaca austrocitrina]
TFPKLATNLATVRHVGNRARALDFKLAAFSPFHGMAILGPEVCGAVEGVLRNERRREDKVDRNMVFFAFGTPNEAVVASKIESARAGVGE